MKIIVYFTVGDLGYTLRPSGGLPCRNEKDLDELSREVREDLNCILVENLAQVFSACFKGEVVRKAA